MTDRTEDLKPTGQLKAEVDAAMVVIARLHERIRAAYGPVEPGRMDGWDSALSILSTEAMKVFYITWAAHQDQRPVEYGALTFAEFMMAVMRRAIFEAEHTRPKRRGAK